MQLQLFEFPERVPAVYVGKYLYTTEHFCVYLLLRKFFNVLEVKKYSKKKKNTYDYRII